ncbi:DNA repair protein RecO [candidate division WOR-3 bacterium]|uniref:DNA repair protein RecO n=1 Tax=candidate division WOR-3 bacterium TaxID=2052148 RepID=A0A9D5KAM5_UNCW3|nr:DNA repair protein RecO [candidate division WOR-3 bacterium]MBD3365378.1 DNA repair protein RecO [candidate division WOR-3 bacterium]
MSRLVRCEGLVLKSYPFRESSKIVCVLTKTQGRVDLLARGARKPGSRFGAGLEIGTEASFIFYEREQKTLWTLSAADILSSHQALRDDPESLNKLARILKVLRHISHPGENNPGVYNLTLAVLNAMDMGKLKGVYELFLWRITTLSGYPPRMGEGCLVCGRKDTTFFSVKQGGTLCKTHARDAVRLSDKEFLLLKELNEVSPSFFNLELTPLLEGLIRRYARYHLHADEKVIA